MFALFKFPVFFNFLVCGETKAKAVTQRALRPC